MKGRHVVILVFVFGLSLMAILFRLLPSAKPPPQPPPSAPVVPPPPPTPREPYAPQDPQKSGTIDVTVKSKGQPVAGAKVTFQAQKTFEMTTGADGKCQANVEPGAWLLIARGSGDTAPDTKPVTVATGRATAVEFDLAAGVKLEGTVRDTAGAPVAGAKVALEMQDPAYSTRTDASGKYALNNVPPGKYTVVASSERLRPHAIKDLELLTPGRTVPQDFTLTQGAGVGGRVVDDTGAPVVRAVVTVSNEVSRVVRTDEHGNFKAEGMGEEPVTVLVSARGFAPGSEANVAPGRADVTIRLVRGATLQGKVEGLPDPFTVNLSKFDEATSKFSLVRSELVPVQSEGVFYIRDLAPGRYELEVEAPKHRTPAPVPVPTPLESGQTTNMGVIVVAPK